MYVKKLSMKKQCLTTLKSLCLSALIVLWGGLLSAQVTGVITDAANGDPLIGASVFVKGTTTGTISDIDGSYSLNASATDILVFSFVGYTEIEEAINGRSVVNIAMSQGALLDEVVVTGYASQQKRDLTGAVGVVSTKQLLQIPSANVNSQLQGRVSGVTVSGDGRPGSVAKVRIRGFSSLGDNSPLFIVDGVPTLDVSTLNPNDVETMSVLKDAGAASIYGSRAANGVILITTKKGSNSGVKVNYDMYVGTQNPSVGNLNLLNAQEYADLQWLVYRNDGTVEDHPFYGPSTNARPTLPAWAGDTDWFNVISRNGMMMNHDVSLSGGSENATFYAGLNYFNQEGIVIENFSQRFSARLNSEFKVAKGRITLGENLTITSRDGNGVEGNNAEGSPISRVFMSQPIIPHIITKETQGTARLFQVGEFGGTGIAPRTGSTPNIFADLTRARENRQRDTRLIGSVYMNVNIINGLDFKTTFGGTYQNGYNTNWVGQTYERAENQATSSYGEDAYYNADWVWTNSLTYNTSFGDHKLLAVAGYESLKLGIGRGLNANRAGYFSIDPAFRTVGNGAQITSASSYFVTPRTLLSQFLRADYSFNDRYYLSATVRRDGASVFGPTNKYGIFPSVSAGVRVSDFMGTSDVLNDLKVRGGYGTMGNQNPVSTSNQFSLFGGDPATSFYDISGTGSSSQQGFRPTSLGNSDTQWETQTTTNIGFDATMFNSKLQVSFDWYNKQASDLLVTVPLSAIYGAADKPALNVGSMKTTGVDLQLDYRTELTDDIGLDLTGTFTTYKNRLVRFADNVEFFDVGVGSRIGSFNRNQVGQPLSAMFGYDVIGLFRDQADVDGSPTQDGAEPGFFKYRDVDGNGVITPDDRTFIGDPNPDFTYGLNIGVNYKNFDFSAFLFGSQGNEIFNYNKWWLDFWPSFQNQKSSALLYESWTPQNLDATVPKASNKSNFSNNTQSTSYYVENGSFLRLRTIQLGYTLPTSASSAIGLGRVRAYVQAANLFTVTGYSGIDPDVNNGGDLAFGVDFGNYPLTRTILFGLNIGF